MDTVLNEIGDVLLYSIVILTMFVTVQNKREIHQLRQQIRLLTMQQSEPTSEGSQKDG